MKKMICLFALSLALIFVFAACTNDSGNVTTSPSASPSDKLNDTPTPETTIDPSHTTVPDDSILDDDLIPDGNGSIFTEKPTDNGEMTTQTPSATPTDIR